MMMNCQEVKIRKQPHTHLATDITNFTSAVCAVFLESKEFKAVYTTVGQNSAAWYQKLSYNPSNFQLSISNGNSVNLSSLAISSGSIDAIVAGIVFSNSGFWDATYNAVLNNSANWNIAYTISQDYSGLWNSSYTTVQENSAKWENAYSTSLDNDVRIKQLMGTGLIQGGTISLNPDPTLFNVLSGIGYIVDNWTNPLQPTLQTIFWNSSSGIFDEHLGDYISTDLFIDSNGGLIQQTARVSQDDLRNYIFLGRTVHPNLSTITTVASLPHVRTNLPLLIDDLIAAIGVINITGNVISPSGTNLSIKRSAGAIFRLGANFTNNPKIPNTTNLLAANPVSLLYRYRNGTGGYLTQPSRTTINPLLWDNGSGNLQTVPNKHFTIQRVYQFTTGLTYITYGQTNYSSLSLAVDAINSETPDIDIQLNDACLLAYIVIGERCTDLTNNLEAKIVTAGKFSGTGGGSSSSGGNVIGPSVAINNSFARFDGTTGSIIKDNGNNSTLDDNGNAIFTGTLSTGGIIYDNTGKSSTDWNTVFSTVRSFSSEWNKTFELSSLMIATNLTNGVVVKTYDSTPASGNVSLFAKTDNKLYLKTAAGVETDLTSIEDSAWTTYTVSWTSQSGTQPSLQNGTIVGKYRKIGKTVFVNIKWTAGSSTTYGDNGAAWLFSLPINAKTPESIVLPVAILDNGTAWYQGTAIGTYAGAVDKTAIIVNTSNSNSDAVSYGTPMTNWATSDAIMIGGSYECV